MIGSSVVDANDKKDLKLAASGTPCIMVPNFSIAAVLMMQFAQTAAKHFPDVEIVEYHNEKGIECA